jgi:hypothetical protein
MENNKSPKRLIIYLMAAIWVYLLFYCTLFNPTPTYVLLERTGVAVAVHIAMNLFLVYATLSTSPWHWHIVISGILAATLAASLTLFASWPPSLSGLPNAALLMLGILNWTFILAVVLYVLGSLFQWQFGPSGVPAKKLSIKALLFVTATVGLLLMVDMALGPKPEQNGFLSFAFFFLPKIFTGLCIAWIATRRRWRLMLLVVMLISTSPLLAYDVLSTGQIFLYPTEFFLQICLPDLIGSGILIWFYIAISRRGWQLHVARNPKVGKRLGTELVQSQGPVGVFPEDANA